MKAIKEIKNDVKTLLTKLESEPVLYLLDEEFNELSYDEQVKIGRALRLKRVLTEYLELE